MTPEQFCYWLQGFAELNQDPPTSAQWACIVEHINTVFNKVTTPSSRFQEALDEAAKKAAKTRQPFQPSLDKRIC